MVPDPEILVIGLGPAGSRAAEAAATAGIRVLAVDRRKRAGFPVQCAEFVPAMLTQELDRLGQVTSQRIEAMVTFVEKLPPDLKSDFPGLMIDRAEFDAKLVARARDAGAVCRFQTEVRTIGLQGDVHLSDGASIRPRVIVGADGPRSPTGIAVGRPNTDIVETRQITVPLRQPYRATDIFLAGSIPGGYGWLFPKDNLANLGIGVAPTAKHRLKELLEDLHEALIADERVGTQVLGYTGGAIPVGGMRNPVACKGEVPVLLVGDAAGLANPITGAGIASAVTSGRLAGEAAARWLGGETDSLADFAEELEELFGPALDRALDRRSEILELHERGAQPSPEALRRGWIAYPEYWAA
ncbi:MAG: NAD(P)/FAD-dependent oxidoreductase [Rhodospirillaceae bacterium]|nr:NAD(P)/FAD-dependent oxidoreductase [Rhodospirillaceae bacterium]